MSGGGRLRPGRSRLSCGSRGRGASQTMTATSVFACWSPKQVSERCECLWRHLCQLLSQFQNVGRRRMAALGRFCSADVGFDVGSSARWPFFRITSLFFDSPWGYF